ncbi:alpha-galactosidase [Chitinophaga pendula]|uniref:alpha-galactosidase n=1 Tax=Chitinophaga TaxID=79328 RepID=UPI000BAEDA1A|nr:MULTISPECIES: alpha-galactosidase [Chitinophaga]ASZ11057.1 alpha-galactosidase [Chitinophaga sp. MD30]UCJ05946.1 alpha-galactosidase [Chitinophaga pendula]
MKKRFLLTGLLLITLLPYLLAQQQTDWMINPRPFKAAISRSGNKITMTNGLLKRSFYIGANLACFDFQNLSTGEQLIRAVKPEARLTINGKDYNVGGLYGQPQQAYLLPVWLDSMTAGTEDFRYISHRITDITPYVNWRPTRWSGNRQQPTGKELIFTYRTSTPALKDYTVEVHYALYDGIPLLCKWLKVINGSSRSLVLDQVVNEIMATVEEETAVVGKVDQMKPPHGLYIESNYAFNNAMKANLSDQTTHWKADATYTAQVNYDLQTPCLLEVHPAIPVGTSLPAGESFSSIRTYELLLDSYDRERNGLAQRRMYRTIAPWTTENPVFMHLISTDPAQVRSVIDQCAATGYEGVILSFGSGLNMEDTSAANRQKFKSLADYAHSKQVLLGGYSLFSSRRISDEDDVINPATGKPGGAFFNNAPCLGSKWGLSYLEKIKHFIATTGFDIFENDGPYPGDICASVTHPGHHDVKDSQWKQMELQKAFYRHLNEMGVYVNAPDWYFLDGTNKIGLGYREVNFSLPRAQQIILNRQNIYDGTWEKTPGMSWGFVPLTQYQGGGAAATLEPLKDHLHAYEQLMMQYYGAGIQACYRGPRLYDTDSTKVLVTQVINWYKIHRQILNEDVIHLRRADGRDWDGILHVAPSAPERGLAMLYNPLPVPITRNISIPLYYTGLTDKATVSIKGGPARSYPLDRQHNIHLTISIPANNYTWLLIK